MRRKPESISKPPLFHMATRQPAAAIEAMHNRWKCAVPRCNDARIMSKDDVSGYDYYTARSLLGALNSFEFYSSVTALIFDIEAPHHCSETSPFKLRPGSKAKIRAASNLVDYLSACAKNLADTLVYNDYARKKIFEGPDVVRNLIHLQSASRSATASTKAWTASNCKKEELEAMSEHVAPEHRVLLNASAMLVDYRAIVKMLECFIREQKIDTPGSPTEHSARKILFWLLLAIATISTKSDTLAIQENLFKLSSVTKRMPGIERQIQNLFGVFQGAVCNFYEGFAPKIWSKLFDEVRNISTLVQEAPMKTEEPIFTCIANFCTPKDTQKGSTD